MLRERHAQEGRAIVDLLVRERGQDDMISLARRSGATMMRVLQSRIIEDNEELR